MAARQEIAGYTFGSGDVPRSPVSLAEFEDLKRAIGFGSEDERALRELWDVVCNRCEQLFERWIGLVGHFFVPTFAGPDGAPDQAYLDAAHHRFIKWIEDTCTREFDQLWLDYQHEIGLRHHRTKKNQTDGVQSLEIVPFRYLPLTLYPLTSTLPPFIIEAGVDAARAERLGEAWTKSLALQVTLWSYPYVKEGDW